MAIEAPQEGQELDLLQEARRAINTKLVGKAYSGGEALLTSTLHLQAALLQSGLIPEKIYHELAIIAGQGVERARVFEDESTASVLEKLQSGFTLTYETFKSQIGAEARVAQPVSPESLDPMTAAKGGEIRQQPQRRGRSRPTPQ